MLALVPATSGVAINMPDMIGQIIILGLCILRKPYIESISKNMTLFCISIFFYLIFISVFFTLFLLVSFLPYFVLVSFFTLFL